MFKIKEIEESDHIYPTCRCSVRLFPNAVRASQTLPFLSCVRYTVHPFCYLWWKYLSIQIISGLKRSPLNACHYMFLYDRKVKLYRRTVLTDGQTYIVSSTRNEIIVPNGNVSESNFLFPVKLHFSSRQEIRIFTMMKYVSVEIMLWWFSWKISQLMWFPV